MVVMDFIAMPMWNIIKLRSNTRSGKFKMINTIILAIDNAFGGPSSRRLPWAKPTMRHRHVPVMMLVITATIARVAEKA
jgi:hypothetical protein